MNSVLRQPVKFTAVLRQKPQLRATLGPGIPIPGPEGPQGPQGDAATITVDGTYTGPPGTPAQVYNDGTTSAAILRFYIPQGADGAIGPQGPKGDQGLPGDVGAQGPPGQAATITVGSTSTVQPGTPASVTNQGTPQAAVLLFRIPQGTPGQPGMQGPPGTPGASGSVTVGITATGPPGTAASVINSGTALNAILDFTIPQGIQGPKGDQGDPGVPGVPNIPATPTSLGSIMVGSGLSITPDGTLSVTGGGGGAAQTPWTSDIDAAGNNLLNLSNITSQGDLGIYGTNGYQTVIQSGDIGYTQVKVTDQGVSLLGSIANIFTDQFDVYGRYGAGPYLTLTSTGLSVAGDVNITGQYMVNGVPISAGGGSQTPWTSNIDAAYYTLNSVSAIRTSGTSGDANQGIIYFGTGDDYLWFSGSRLYTNVPLNAYSFSGDNVYVNNGVYFGGGTDHWIYRNVGLSKFEFSDGALFNGDVDITGCYRIGGIAVACSDGAGGISLSNITTINGSAPGSGGGGSQTPWLSDIDAAGYGLYNVNYVCNGQYPNYDTLKIDGYPLMLNSVNWRPVQIVGDLTLGAYNRQATLSSATGLLQVTSSVGIVTSTASSGVYALDVASPDIPGQGIARIRCTTAGSAFLDIQIGDYSNGAYGIRFLGVDGSVSARMTGYWGQLSINATSTLNLISGNNQDLTLQPSSGQVTVSGNVNIIDPGNASGYTYRINGTPISTGGAVASVFGRSGAVVAASGDYTAAQVTNAVSTASTYANPAWITSLAWSKITGAPATGVSTVFGRSGAVTAASGDYNATQITMSPTVGSYTTVQAAIAGLNTAIGGVSSQWVNGASGAIYYNGGNVGIGTTAPGARLHLYQPTASGYQLLLQAGSPAAGYGMAIRSDTGDFLFDEIGVATRISLLKGTGNVGIGTVTPLVNLDVLGPPATAAAVPGLGGVVARFKSTTNWCYVAGDTTVANAGGGFAMYSAGVYYGELGCWDGDVYLSAQHYFLYYTSSTGSLALQHLGGNVGIGTLSPNVRLMINSQDNSTPQIALRPADGNYGYGLAVGYSIINSDWRGYLQAYSNNNGPYHIALNPYGGAVSVGTTAVCDQLNIEGMGPGGYGQLRMVYGGYGAFFRNDGNNFFLMRTAVNDQYGTWAAPFPIQVELATAITTLYSLKVSDAIRVGSQGYVQMAGDIGVSRDNNPSQGAFFFGNQPAYIFWDGTNFSFTNNVRVNGTINCAGYYLYDQPLQNALAVSNFTAPGRAVGGIYQNNTGRPLFISISLQINNVSVTVTAVCDSGNPPGYPVAKVATSGAYANEIFNLFFVALPGNFYSLLGTNTVIHLWSEWY